MFQTSQDFLFIVLGIAIIVLVVFISLVFYYLIRILQEFFKFSAELSKMTARLNRTTKIIKEKVKSFSGLSLFGEAVKAMIEFLREKRKEEKEKRNKD